MHVEVWWENIVKCPIRRPRKRQEDISVTCIPIARQLLGKHISARGNAGKNTTFIATQRISKHASLKTDAVFSAWSV
jgi:hypothetical protein